MPHNSTSLHLNTAANSLITKHINTSLPSLHHSDQLINEICPSNNISYQNTSSKVWSQITHDLLLMLVMLTDPGYPGQVLDKHKQLCTCMLIPPLKSNKQNNIPIHTPFQPIAPESIEFDDLPYPQDFTFQFPWKWQFATDSPVTGHRQAFWLMSQCDCTITVMIVILLKQRLAVICI